MDPISIVTLVGTSLGIAVKGATGLIQIYDFYKSISNAPEDIKFLQDDVSAAIDILKQIRQQMQGHPMLLPAVQQSVRRNLGNCKLVLHHVETFAERHHRSSSSSSLSSRIKGRFSFSWDKSEVTKYRNELKTRVDYLCKIFNLALGKGSTVETQNQLVVHLGKDVLSESARASHDASQGNPGKDGDNFDDEDDDDDDAQSGAKSNVQSGVSSRNTNTRRFWKRSSKKWSRALITAAANDDINLMTKCLKKSADIEYRSKDGIPSHEGMAAIHVAAEGNKVAALRMLIEQGANVNSTIKVSGETPLHLTARGGFSTATRDLIRSGANLDVQDQSHQTPLLVANDENVKMILLQAGADPRLYNVEAFTALHYAANFGHNEAVKLMLSDRRTNVDARDKLERTALWMACSSNDAEKSKTKSVVSMLLKAGASPNAESRDANTTPFRMAVERGRNSLVRLMLDNSKVDLASHPDSLHVAAGLSNAKVLQTLLPYYRNINARDPTTGDPPLHVAVRKGRRDSVAALLDWEKTDLRAGSRSDCLAAIHIAFEQDNLAIVELLLKAHKIRGVPIKPIVSCKTHRGLLPVHFSPTAKHIEAWVRAGLPVNMVDSRKGVPILHYHVLFGETEVVTALVKHGADVASKDERGNTAIERLCAEEEVWRSSLQKRLAILRALHNFSPINEVCRANIGKWKDAKLRAAVQGQLPWRTMGETAANLITPGNAVAAVGVVVLGALGIGRK